MTASRSHGLHDRCGQSSYFDREGFNEAQNVQCPMEGCAYAWCKRCQQEIVPNGPEHSCGGSSTQKPLHQRRNWAIGFSWSSLKARVDASANVEPGGVRVQLVSHWGPQRAKKYV